MSFQVENISNICNVTIQNIENYPYQMRSSFQILYVLKGSVKITVVSGQWILNENDIEVINIYEPVKIESVSDSNMIMVFSIENDFVTKYCPNMSNNVYNCNGVLFYESALNREVLEILKFKLANIYMNFINNKNSSLIKQQVKVVLELIDENLNDFENIFKNIPNNVFHLQRFRKIVNYLMNNLNERVSLNDIADKEFLSMQYLSGEFSNKMNNNFNSILSYYRVIESVKLLIESDLSITLISEKCGFSALRYFYKSFKSFMHCTPSEFRKEIAKSTVVKSKLLKIDSNEAKNIIREVINRNTGNSYDTHTDLKIDINANTKSYITNFNKNILYARELVDIYESNEYKKAKYASEQLRCNELYDSMWFAAYLAVCILKGEDLADYISLFDRESGLFLSGQNGIITFDGNPKPSFWMIKFISELNDTIVRIDDNFIISKADNDTMKLLVFNCPVDNMDSLTDIYGENGHFESKRMLISLVNTESSEYIITREAVDSNKLSLIDYWKSLGNPDKLRDRERRLIQKYANPELSFEILGNDTITTEITVPPFSFELITISKK